jgi:hypothetical protein
MVGVSNLKVSRTAKWALVASATLLATVLIAAAAIATTVWVATSDLQIELSPDPPTVAEWCRHNTALLQSGYTPVELLSDDRDFRQHQDLQSAALGYVFLNTPPEPIRLDADRFQRALTRRMEGGRPRPGDVEAAFAVQVFLNECP